jgi:RNA polymerase sigma factor (sigma-70 family)
MRKHLSGRTASAGGIYFNEGAGMAEYLVNELNYRDSAFNESIFSNFYNEYFDKVYNYVYFKTGERVNAEDLVCGIMEKVLNNLHRYQASAGSLDTWIFTIARNHLIDWYRKKERNEEHFEEGEEPQIPDRVTEGPEESMLRAEREETIRELLWRLPETEREIMILKFWGGLKNIEIADQLGINPNSVNVMVFRTLKKIKKMIEDNNIEI